MAQKRNPADKTTKWYDNPVKKGIAVISGFLLVSGLGYGFASVQKSLEFRMEKYEMNQAFNEKLQTQINNCREERLQLENKRVEGIEEVVKELQKNLNGKK